MLQHGGDHDSTPRSAADAAAWQPHDWVLEAILRRSPWTSRPAPGETAPASMSAASAANVGKALLEACDELDHHNAEYHHVTPKEMIQRWVELGTAALPAGPMLAKLKAIASDEHITVPEFCEVCL